MTKDEIVKEIHRRCKIFGVKLDIRPVYKVKAAPGVCCSGYFDPDDRVLACAGRIADEYIIGTLLHEYCHVTQWVENCEAWQNDAIWSSQCNTHEWLGSGQPATRTIKKAFAAARDLEADNERRTVRLIKELEAPIDVALYIRTANSYVHFYNAMLVTNEWYHPDRSPYSMPEVVRLFRSDKIEDNFSKTPKRKLTALMTCSKTRL